MLFLEDEDQAVLTAILAQLPDQFHGYPTHIPPANEHRIWVGTIARFFKDYLDFELEQKISPADWLTFPEQKLRTITAGAIYHDDLNLQAQRDRFAYYPDEVWKYRLASAWTRLGQEEHLMGRAGMVGDEIGSVLIGARLVRDLMNLGFLMEKQYAPYPKWFGSAFARLNCGQTLMPILRAALRSESWQERENHLGQAYELMAAKHNALGITDPLPAQVTSFFDRPYQVIWGDRFAAAIAATIADPAVQQIAARRLIGGIDQFSDSTDLLSTAEWRAKLRELYL